MERRIRVDFMRQPRRDEAAYPWWICGRGVTTDNAKSRRIRPSGLVKPLLVGLIYLLFHASVSAHEPGKSYLNLSLDSGQFTGQWDIPLRDLAAILRLDPDQHGSVNPDQLKPQYADA